MVEGSRCSPQQKAAIGTVNIPGFRELFLVTMKPGPHTTKTRPSSRFKLMLEDLACESYLNSRDTFTFLLTRLQIIRLHHQVIMLMYPETKRLLQGSVGQIIKIGNLLCSLFWIHITQELHHLNWNWLCVVHFALEHRHIPHGDWDWWESATALWRRGAVGSLALI